MAKELYEKSLQFENWVGKWVLPDPKTLVRTNSKTGQAFRSLLRFCSGRTSICSKYCYACKGPISWKGVITNAWSVRRWIEKNGVEAAAERMAAEILYKGIFRWMDRGDFDPLSIMLANRVADLRPDVKFCAFSRKPEALRQLDPAIVRTFSADAQNVERIQELPDDVRVSYLKIIPGEDIPDRASVVFPLNHRRELIGDRRDCSAFKDKRVKCTSCLRCFR